MLLRMHDYQVTTADSIASGAATAKNETFDAYVLDTGFADGTGEELCQKIREFDPFTPVIFYTGYLFNGSRERALSFGAQDYILKPDFDALRKTLDRTLDLAPGESSDSRKHPVVDWQAFSEQKKKFERPSTENEA